MLLGVAVALVVGAVFLTLFVRPGDLPAPEPESPYAHLEARKAQIYENLRDLAFEYRVGKLSDADYQSTKTGLQGELAQVLAQIDEVAKGMPAPAAVKPGKARKGEKTAAAVNVCPHCGARFDRALKFCGECGRPMAKEAS